MSFSEEEKKCSLLIVDDEPENIQLLGNILGEKGYDNFNQKMCWEIGVTVNGTK